MKKQKYILIILMIIMTMFNVSAVSVSATADESDTVILGGEPFGIKMFAEGVMVIKTENVKGSLSTGCPAEEAGIKANDIIISANGKKLNSNEELSKIIESSQGNTITMNIKRNDEIFTAQLTPSKNAQGIYKAGMWVKDSAAGIGTVTFYSEELGGFCGLGHGICESSTGILIPISYGEIEGAYIASVTTSCDRTHRYSGAKQQPWNIRQNRITNNR